MSSILDALKKLESEKAGKERPVERAEIEAVAAERDLTRRRRNPPEGEMVRVSSVALILGGLTAIAVLVSVSAVAALVIVRAMDDQRVVKAVTPPVGAAPVQTAPFQPVPVMDVAPSVPAPAPLEPVASEPGFEEPAARVSAVEPVAPISEPVNWVQPEPAVAAPENPPPTRSQRATVPAPEAAAPPPAEEVAPIGEVDLATLPVLTESERIRLGLPNMKINIVGLPSKRQPRPSALINFEKIFLGEYIPNTRARLIAVDLRGVGIDVGGMRYFLEK